MQRPSILFVNRVYPPVRGASGRVLRDLARSFAREGWQVTVITTGPKAGSERDGAVRVIRVKGAEKPKGGLGYLWILFKLFWAALTLPKTHILVTQTDPPFLAIIGRIVSTFKRNRHIHWCMDVYPDVFPALGVRYPAFLVKFLKARMVGAMRSADRVIVIGRCMARSLVNAGVEKGQISVIPNWANAELDQASQDDFYGEVSVDGLESFRAYEEQRKSGPKFRVLYAGSLGLAHPFETLLDTAEILNESHDDIEFVFVGDGARHDELSKARTKRNLENVRLLPYQPASRLKELMESGDVHLISMDMAAAGLIVPVKLYSALAVHRPCILVGPAKSETAKIIKDFNAGFVIPQGKPKVVAEKIRQLRENSAMWFEAHEGAKAASAQMPPAVSIRAWMERAWGVIESDIDRDFDTDI